MPKIVQFLHPGQEHTEETGTVWTASKSHKRKYLKTKGGFFDGSKVTESELNFWGEWEPPSKVISTASEKSNFPTVLFEPYLDKSYIGKFRYNTDPFVFGNIFYYCVCKQSCNKMRLLENVSLIVFGSNIGNEFCIDTVFIVKDRTDYDKGNYHHLRNKTNEAYFEASINPLFDGIVENQKLKNTEKISYKACMEECDDQKKECYSKEKDYPYSSYSAVMYSENDKIFSFTPCIPSAPLEKGFERPSLKHLDPYINPALMMGLKITDVSDEKIFEVWTSIKDQVLDKNLKLMIHSELPSFL